MLLRQLSVRRPCNMIYVLVKGISSWLDVWGLLLRTTLGYVWRRRCRGSSRLTWRMQITHRPRCSPSELPSRFRDIYLDTEMQLIGSLERACRLRLRSPRWIKYQLGSGWKVGCVREPEGPRVACRRQFFHMPLKVFIRTNPFYFCCEENSRIRKQHCRIGD